MVSVVTPIFNELANLPELSRRLGQVFTAERNHQWEWIAVDDGSSDGGVAFLEGLSIPCPLKIVRLSRNFGQQSALMAGLHEARGQAVIFLDGDLQDPPEVIPDLVRSWEKGAEVVFGRRISRGEPGVRRFFIRIFHRIFGKLTGHFMPPDSGNFGLVDARVAEVLRGMTEHSLYLPGLRAWAGFRRDTVDYHRAGRVRGTALSLARLFGFGWDAIVGFSEAPLRLIAALGAVISVAGFFYGGWLVIQRILQFFGLFKGLEVLGFTTVAVSVFFMGGVQLICLGVIGEYLARIYREVKGRPRYLVANVIKKTPAAEAGAATL